MIDIKRIIEDTENITKSLLKRMDNVEFSNVINLYNERIKLLQQVEEKKAIKNKFAKEVGLLKRDGQVTETLIKEMTDSNETIIALDLQIKEIEQKINHFLIALPNIPDEDVVSGGKENNKVIKTYLEKRNYDFDVKEHYELCKQLNLIDYDRGIKLAGAGSWIYTGLGARIEWALINYFIDQHIKDNYQFLMLPYMLNYECGYGAGQFPKFNEDVYWIDGNDRKFLMPTAETALVNLHKDEILNINELPKKYFAFTQCFRKEAGSSRVYERGTIRGHQFNKVEMVQYVEEGKTEIAFEELLGKAEKIIQDLGLHYQVSKLAAGDCSGAMCRTYDIEVWIPSIGRYTEVSSVSNSRDYQTRRNNTKYRDESGKIKYVQTLNASALATSRLVPAIVEQFQNADGSVNVPEVLVPYLQGIKILK